MAQYRAQVILHSTSLMPEDDIVNVFHFASAGAAAEADAALIAGSLEEAYTAIHAPGATRLDAWLSMELSRAVLPTVKVYDLAVPGSPLLTTDFADFGDGQAGASLPSETALCLTSHSDLTGVPERVAQPPDGPAGDQRLRARRRSRTYFGPFVAAGNTGTPGGPTVTLQAVLRGFGIFLRDDAVLDAAGINWAVFSAADGNVMRPIVGGWVDNAWDNQRRRGRQATARTAW